MTATLARRLAVLERASWERRKRELLHAAFFDAAQDCGWSPDQLERQVQAVLDEFNGMEPALLAICRRGGTQHDLTAYIADRVGRDVDELKATAARLPRLGALDDCDVDWAGRSLR